MAKSRVPAVGLPHDVEDLQQARTDPVHVRTVGLAAADDSASGGGAILTSATRRAPGRPPSGRFGHLAAAPSRPTPTRSSRWRAD